MLRLSVAPSLSGTAESISGGRVHASGGEFSRAWVLALLLEDVAAFLLSAYAATALVFHSWRGPVARPEEPLSIAIFVALWLVVFSKLGLYKRSFALSAGDELYYTFAALALGILPQLTIFTVWPSVSTSRAVLILALAFAGVFVGGSRALEHKRRDAYLRRRPARVAVFGDAQAGGDVEEYFAAAVAAGCRRIVLATALPQNAMSLLLERATGSGIEIAFALPQLCARGRRLRVECDGDHVVLLADPLPACTPLARLCKRMFDVTGAAAALALLWPVVALAALLVCLESRGPVIYRQTRVGRSGRVFEMLKLRTMRSDAEAFSGAVFATLNDRRLTRVGKWLRRFSIDEIVQLVNVLRGDMSLIGPRPERPEFVERFRRAIPRYDERHCVSPGITGWAQISLPRVLDASQTPEKLARDLFYIENWSLFFDVSILVKTAFEFLFHRAA